MTCESLQKRVSEFIRGVSKGTVLGSTEVAVGSLELIKVASSTCRNLFKEFLGDFIPRVVASRPPSQVVENILRRYLEEFVKLKAEAGFERAVDATQDIVDSLIRELDLVRDAVAEIGSRRIENGDTILTHSYSTTVLRVFEKAVKRGTTFRVYVTESRPIGEGRVTASNLSRLGIETTLIVDSAVRYVMKRVNKVFVGADAIAVNGAIINKVGTSAVALVAKEARSRLYVLAGTYKLSFETVFGELIEQVFLEDVELIIPKEKIQGLPSDVRVRAPLFDVTPPEYIDAIITEKGVLAPQAVPVLVATLYGWPPKIKSLRELLREVGEE
ncbi:MAG: translation initiation factor eIF-2B [Thermoprotei archaeon]